MALSPPAGTGVGAAVAELGEDHRPAVALLPIAKGREHVLAVAVARPATGELLDARAGAERGRGAADRWRDVEWESRLNS